MELTREILDQITKDATFARDIESIIVSVHPETVLALVAEIERQREEIAALREAREQNKAHIEALWASIAEHESAGEVYRGAIKGYREALADAKTLIEKPRTPIENDYAEYAEQRQHFFWTLRDMGIDGAKSGVSSERRFVPNVRVKYTATDAAHRSGQLGVIAGSDVDYLEVEFEDGLVEGVKRTELQSV